MNPADTFQWMQVMQEMQEFKMQRMSLIDATARAKNEVATWIYEGVESSNGRAPIHLRGPWLFACVAVYLDGL